MSKQLEIAEFGEIPYDKAKVALIMKLLEQTTTLEVVSSFLKSKGEHFSAGSWSDMLSNRIEPAISRGAITIGDMIGLLDQAEEYGGTHSYLFKCSAANARNLISEATVKSALKKCGLFDLLETPRVLDQPVEPTAVAVRWDNDKRGKCLVAKVVERRFRLEPGPVHNSENEVTRKWTKVPVRTVNVMRLYASGLLELRLQSHTNSSDYGTETKAVWGLLSDLFPPAAFDTLSLSKAKTELYRRKDEFKPLLRFADSKLRDDLGATITAGTAGEQSSLFANKGASESVGAFLKHGGHCDEFNIWWLAQKNQVPSRDVHMMISGQPNEFRVTGSCTKDDFEYAFDKLYELV